MHRHIQGTSGRMIRVLLAAVLLLNAAAPAVAAANATPFDAGQAQHAGHDMSDMAMDGGLSGHPATDCCDDGSMDCQCGCVVQQPGPLQFAAAARVYAGAPAPAAPGTSRRTSNQLTTPFRPPA